MVQRGQLIELREAQVGRGFHGLTWGSVDDFCEVYHCSGHRAVDFRRFFMSPGSQLRTILNQRKLLRVFVGESFVFGLWSERVNLGTKG